MNDFSRTFLATAAVVAFALAASPASADVFFVTDIIDAIPAPEGSLRWAIEQSESNGRSDSILFLIDGGTIHLVAPLPDLLEGRLTIGENVFSSGSPPGVGFAITVDGSEVVPRAIAVLSAENRINGLGFARFSGTEAVLIARQQAKDNRIGSCAFRNNEGAGVRISAIPGGLPSGTRIGQSAFTGNASGVVIEGDPGGGSSGLASFRGTSIRDSLFGTTSFGVPGDNGPVIQATGSGPVTIEDNVFSGPGQGIRLGPGADDSLVAGNLIGLHEPPANSCAGFPGAALAIEDSEDVRVRGNTILCSEYGILLDVGARRAVIYDNEIGGDAPRGHASHGIFIDSAGENLIVGNRISGNSGSGIAASPFTDRNLISCNSISRNVLDAISLPGVGTLPPVLTQANPLTVEGVLVGNPGDWVELFGDLLNEAAVFQGAVRTASVDPPFRHRLPVLGMALGQVAAGTFVTFDTAVPANHTATLSDVVSNETSELSVLLAASTVPLAYDVIRGNVGALSLLPAGGIDLGEVVCLGSGLPPDDVVVPMVIDPERPEPGHAFFYLARRRVSTATNARGTYDPALCLTVARAFAGPRIPASGDCQP